VKYFSYNPLFKKKTKFYKKIFPFKDKYHCVGVYLFRKITVPQLVAHLKEKCVITSDVTRRMVIEKLSISDADLEIETTEYKVSLHCPLMKFRLMLPGRSTDCRHVQCFDLECFLMMNEKKPTWLCPVCDKYILFDTLVVDGLMQEVLKATAGSDVDEVSFNAEGEWSRVGGKETSGGSKQQRPSVSNSASSTSVSKGQGSQIKQNPNLTELLSDEDEAATGINVSGSSSVNNGGACLKTNDDLVNICGKYTEFLTLLIIITFTICSIQSLI
jgi:hypothetical protein